MNGRDEALQVRLLVDGEQRDRPLCTCWSTGTPMSHPEPPTLPSELVLWMMVGGGDRVAESTQ